MGLPNVFNTGRSGMMATKAAIATTGHNISNANTEGYSRQRVLTTTETPQSGMGHLIGSGTRVSRVERVNDEYIDKQVRNGARDMAHMEEKDIVLKQTEDIFNEMNGDGLNRLISRFFNEFRKLSNEPDNEAMRQSVRESSQAMVNDFHRIRNEVEEVRKHIDSRVSGDLSEVNALADEISALNQQIKEVAVHGVPNDLLDKRDMAVKKLATYFDVSVHKDREGHVMVDVKGVGPLVSGPISQKFTAATSPADDQGKPEGSVDVATSGSSSPVTHQLRGGKVGALIEARDKTLSTVLDRLDELAFQMTDAVNQIHTQGVTRHGATGVEFFKRLGSQSRASEFIELSDAVRGNVNHIATAAAQDSPGDNRIALAISGLQGQRIMNEGKSSFDDWYNSIVSDVGVATAKNRLGMNQQKDIITQLNKMRDQVSGVSIDEETANLMQYQHTFDASAKVLQIADELMKTVLDLKR